MATRPTSLELRQYTSRRKELQGHADPTMLRLFRFLELVWVFRTFGSSARRHGSGRQPPVYETSACQKSMD